MAILDSRGVAIVSIVVVTLAFAVAIPPFIDATGEDSSKTITQTEGEDVQLTGTLFADLTNVRSGQSFAEVASIHTTDTDFSGADTLDGVTVEGSGESAYVSLSISPDRNVIDGFEDGNINEWSGDTGVYSVTSNRVAEGSLSLERDDTSGSGTMQTGVPTDTYSNFSFYYQDSGPGTTSSLSIYRMFDSSGNGLLEVGISDATTGDAGSLLVYTGSWEDTGVDISADTYYLIEIEGIDYSTDTFDVRVTLLDGSLVGTSTGHSFWQSSSDISDIEVRASDRKVWYDGFGHATTNGGASEGTYISSTHSVNGADDGFTNLTISDAEATVTWEGDTDGDGSFETQISEDIRTSTGNYTVDLSGTSGQNFRVNVTFNSTSSSPTAQLDDEGILLSTTDGTDVNATLVDTDTGETVETGPINESETRQFSIGGETVTVSNEDVLSGDRSLMTYQYPTYYGADSGVEPLLSNAPLIVLSLGLILVIMGLYAGRSI